MAGNLGEFGNGHGGAGGAPVAGESNSVASETAPAAGLQHIVDEKGVKRPLILNPVSKKLEPAKFADEYDYPGANPADITRAKNRWIGAGKAIIGETHDEQGNPIANEKVEAFNKPVRPEKFVTQKRPVAAGTGAGSEYEAKLRKNMPQGPGTGKATRSQRQILQNAAANLVILNTHHDNIGAELTDGKGNELVDHPAYDSHANAGAHLATAEYYLGLAKKAKASNNVEEANNHMRTATDALHTANRVMHSSVFDITKAGQPPIGTGVTDEDRAHSLVEFPMAKSAGKLNKTLKIGRGEMSQVENSRDTFEKLARIRLGMMSKDPSIRGLYAGLNPSVVRRMLKFSQVGTEKGSQEWSDTNAGPQTAVSTSMGRPFNAIGFGGSGAAVQSSVTGSPENVVKTNKLMVAVHPNPAPQGAFVANDTDPVTGKIIPGTRKLIHKGKEIPFPKAEDRKFVEFGKHIGLKVIDKNGYEVPHMDENNKPMTWKELSSSPAHTMVQTIKSPVQPLPQATKPAKPAAAKPRNWDTLPKRKRAAITARQSDAERAIQARIDELENEKTIRISAERAAPELIKENTPARKPKKRSR